MRNVFSCFVCKVSTRSGSRLCNSCANFLPYNTNSCAICSISLGYVSNNTSICYFCSTRANRLRIISAFRYEGIISYWVKMIKYHSRLDLIHLLSELFIDYLFTDSKFTYVDFLVPVPLHTRKIKRRGFNQSLEMVRLMSIMLDIPMCIDTCVRVLDGDSQVGSKMGKRKLNIQGAFSIVNSRLIGAKVALVDDVVTSAATVSELSSMLYLSGVKSVVVWSFARCSTSKNHD